MPGRHRRRQGLGLAALVALLVVAGHGGAATRGATAFDGANLDVSYLSFQSQSLLAVSLDLAGGAISSGAPPVAAHVDLNVPAGYQFDLSGAPGAPVGDLSAGVLDASNGSGFTFVDAPIVVDDPAVFAADPVAQACAPGVHAALWRASLAVLGQQIPLSIVVDGASGTGVYTLRFCPLHALPGLTAGAGLVVMTMFVRDRVTGPTTPGTYTWSALISPPVPGSTAPDPARTVEIRALLPIPETFRLHARYDAKTRTAIVIGMLAAAGAPESGASVDVSSTTGSNGGHTDLGSVTTDATGSFALRRPVDRTTTFSATVQDRPRPCSAPSSAPGGCVSETVSQPGDASATVIVPRKTDPRLAVRPRDQAVARRSVLTASDFPNGWPALADAPGPCEAFTPQLRKLTATGQAFSPVFVAPDGSAAAVSTASVFLTRSDASTAFAREAQVGAARCAAAEEVSGSSATVSGVGPLAVPRIGDASRAFRAVVQSQDGQITIDLVFLRVGRAVIELDVYSLGASEVGLEAQLGRALAARARRQ